MVIDEVGILNAFEEYMVRGLTEAILNGNIPKTLNLFFDQELNKLKQKIKKN